MVCVELPLLVRIYLTSTNVDNRSSGTRLLSEVLTQIDPNCLNSDEGWCVLRYNLNPSLILSIHPPHQVHYIVAFYCDRLKDKAIVIPHVLTGIHALVRPFYLRYEHYVNICCCFFCMCVCL